MFGFSLSHMIMIGIVALIFVGPKQLPEVARTLAKLLRDLRGFSDDFTTSLSQLAKENPVKPETPSTEANLKAPTQPSLPSDTSSHTGSLTETDPAKLADSPSQLGDGSDIEGTVSTQRVRRSTEEQS